MLPSTRNNLTLSILSRLRDKGAPKSKSYDLMGEADSSDNAEDEDSNSMGTEVRAAPSSDLLRKAKKKSPLRGSSEDEEDAG